jgi:hypothetical protein
MLEWSGLLVQCDQCPYKKRTHAHIYTTWRLSHRLGRCFHKSRDASDIHQATDTREKHGKDPLPHIPQEETTLLTPPS